MSLEDGAEEKFWNTPELLEMLLPFLDVASILRLAKSHFSSENDALVLDVLQRPLVWKKLIERSLPESQNDSRERQEDMLEIKKSTVEFLTDILKMFKNPVSLEMDLLVLICRRFPPYNSHLVHLSHHLPPDQFWTHSVSPLGFILLEVVESTLSTTKQKVEKIQVEVLKEPLLSAISGRVSRQQRRISELKTENVWCYSNESAEAVCALVNHCQILTACHLIVFGDVGREGWRALRKAVSSPAAGYHPLPLLSVTAPPRVMVEGRKEDLRDIWEVVASHWIIEQHTGGGFEILAKDDPEDVDYNLGRWRRLERLMDMEKEEMDQENSRNKQEEDNMNKQEDSMNKQEEAKEGEYIE